jgi:23S rRNA (guanosine2251-2'-O)-methyltransferase
MDENSTEGRVEPHRAGLRSWALPELPRHRLRLVLDQVRSAYNVGALFRTADAAAVDRISLVGFTPHPPHPQLEKTALGATSYVPWEHRCDTDALLAELERDGYELVALETGPDAVVIWDFCWPLRTALVVGNEVEGVSPEVLKACRRKVCLPMFGYKGSLNVTTALGIAMYEFLRAQHGPGEQGRASADEKQAP